jgi:hypothetical protein
MEKEWFNGFVANGLQFRLDGSMINDFGVTYHIGVKNISGHLVEIEDRVYFRFDYKKLLILNCRYLKSCADNISLAHSVKYDSSSFNSLAPFQ